MDTLAERLRALRMTKNWSLRELSRQSGISAGYISDVEKGGHKRISGQKILALARALGVSASDLLGEEGQQYPIVDEDEIANDIEIAIGGQIVLSVEARHKIAERIRARYFRWLKEHPPGSH